MRSDSGKNCRFGITAGKTGAYNADLHGIGTCCYSGAYFKERKSSTLFSHYKNRSLPPESPEQAPTPSPPLSPLEHTADTTNSLFHDAHEKYAMKFNLPCEDSRMAGSTLIQQLLLDNIVVYTYCKIFVLVFSATCPHLIKLCD